MQIDFALLLITTYKIIAEENLCRMKSRFVEWHWHNQQVES